MPGEVHAELAVRRLSDIVAKDCRDVDAEFTECNDDVLVYLMVICSPHVAHTKLIDSLKAVSGCLLREWRPVVRGRYRQGGFLVAVMLCSLLR